MNKRVLVRNISSLSEARYCAGMLVDYIGFEFDPKHADYVDHLKRAEIRNWISGPKMLGSYSGLLDQESWVEIDTQNLDGFIFQYDQIHWATSPVFLKKLKILDLSNEQEIHPNIENFDFIISNVENVQSIPIEKRWLGYDFEFVKSDQEVLGYAFYGSLETIVGANSYDDLMDALDILDS